jgi:hypothetical protein
VVENDNGGKCGTILVDGKPWQHPIGTPGKVEAGRHTIDCGGEISVEIEPGMTFYFNYWGP